MSGERRPRYNPQAQDPGLAKGLAINQPHAVCCPSSQPRGYGLVCTPRLLWSSQRPCM